MHEWVPQNKLLKAFGRVPKVNESNINQFSDAQCGTMQENINSADNQAYKYIQSIIQYI